MRELAERVKRLRKRERLSIEAMSKQTGISMGAISYWENGKGDIKGDQLLTLAKFFECSTDYLLGND